MGEDCRVVRELIPLEQEQLLGESAAGFVKDHAARCAECRAALTQAEALEERAREAPPAGSLDAACVAALGRVRRARRLRRALGALAALVLAAWLGGAWLTGSLNPMDLGRTAWTVLTGGRLTVYAAGESRRALALEALDAQALGEALGLTLDHVHGEAAAFNGPDGRYLACPVGEALGYRMWEILKTEAR